MADPWLKFFTSDWRSDPALRMCSPAARGVWIEMICLMHEATPYGHLLVNGRAPTEAQLAVLIGAPSDELPALVRELDEAGVFSRTKEGVIYSRKLTRMAKKAATARKNGRKGGNPTLGNKRENPASDNPPVKGQDKTQKPEARSQSYSVTNVTGAEAPKPPPDNPPEIDPDKVMFDSGVALLKAAKVPDRQARSVLGKWRAAHGAAAVIDAIGRARRENAIDPVSFIEGCFRYAKQRGPSNGQTRKRPDGTTEEFVDGITGWVAVRA